MSKVISHVKSVKRPIKNLKHSTILNLLDLHISTTLEMEAMQAIIVAIAYIFLTILAVFVVRAMMNATKIQTNIDDVKTTLQAHSRRLDQLTSAVSTIQSALLNISAGATEILQTRGADQQQQTEQNASAVAASLRAKGITASVMSSKNAMANNVAAPTNTALPLTNLSSSSPPIAPSQNNQNNDFLGSVLTSVKGAVNDVVASLTSQQKSQQQQPPAQAKSRAPSSVPKKTAMSARKSNKDTNKKHVIKIEETPTYVGDEDDDYGDDYDQESDFYDDDDYEVNAPIAYKTLQKKLKAIK